MVLCVYCWSFEAVLYKFVRSFCAVFCQSLFWREGCEDTLRTISLAKCSQGWPIIFLKFILWQQPSVVKVDLPFFVKFVVWQPPSVVKVDPPFFVEIFIMAAAKFNQGWPTVSVKIYIIAAAKCSQGWPTIFCEDFILAAAKYSQGWLTIFGRFIKGRVYKSITNEIKWDKKKLRVTLLWRLRPRHTSAWEHMKTAYDYIPWLTHQNQRSIQKQSD